MRILLFYAFLAASEFTYAQGNLQASCDNSTSTPINLTIDPNKIVRRAVPKTLFGFTIDWFQFGIGHFRNGVVRPETLAWLKPFSGAAYRYSGGNELEWSKMVGPVENRQKVYSNMEGFTFPYFGPGEFMSFLATVRGRGVILLNVAAKRLNSGAQDLMIRDNLAYINWLEQDKNIKCANTTICGIDAYELGNEVDWEQGLRWSGTYYADRMDILQQAIFPRFPNIKLVTNGRTAPWGPGGDSYNELSFDSTVAKKLAKKVSGVTLHPYYDGLPISEMEKHIKRLHTAYSPYNDKTSVFITEHGLWPSTPKSGNWLENSYQGSGSGGGVSTADFVLMTMNNPIVTHSMWHTIAVRSPWQLFHLNMATDSIYPSGVYWALRTIREGMLDDTISTEPSLVSGNSYVGGYDFRFIGMKNSVGNISLLGVNRSNTNTLVNINIRDDRTEKTTGVLRTFSADSRGSGNTDLEPFRFQMETTKINGEAEIRQICIPAKSTFSLVLR